MASPKRDHFVLLDTRTLYHFQETVFFYLSFFFFFLFFFTRFKHVNMIQREHSNTNYNDTAKKKNIIIKLTVNLLDLVSRINPLFKKDLMYKPTRTLTQPSEPSTNAGYDNILNDYILRVNERIGDIKRYFSGLYYS
jgi:hypothetical protein